MKKRKRRLTKMMVIMFLLWALAVANVLFVMVTKTHLWSGKEVLDSRVQSADVSETIEAKRGTFYDRNKNIIAQDMKSYTIIAYTKYYYSEDDTEIASENANYYQNPQEVAKQLGSVLDINEESVTHILEWALNKKKKQVELGYGTKRISEQQMELIKTLDIDGIDFVEDSTRYYSSSPFASNLIGFANYDTDTNKFKGILGLEKSINTILSGENGTVKYQQSRKGNLIPGTVQVTEPATDGKDINLTLDSGLQTTVESALQTTIEQNDAQSAWCIVMECETGKILAWSSYPTFDQNNVTEIPVYINALSEQSYELGSVMKAFTYAIAIDTGVYPNNKEFTSHEFWYTVEENKIKRIEEGEESVYEPISDALDQDFGEITFDEGFALSSNVGICELLANYVSYDDYYKYMKEFGFFDKVKMDYVKDSEGMTPLKDTFNTSLATDYLSTGFGQSTSVTPLQLIQAYSAIFNDGNMVKPYVVESITDSKTGDVVEEYSTEVKPVISSDTSKQVCSLMKKVVEEGGTGERFAIDGIDMIAKTGTAQIFDSQTQTYKEDLYTNSIMAAAPSNDPKIMVYYGLQSSNYYYDTSSFKEILMSALTCNTIDASQKKEESNEGNNNQNSFIVPNVTNHSIEHAKKQLEGHDNTVVIGDGSSVVDQYPQSGTMVEATETVFLLTEGSHYTMPDMTNWTMKEISAFWNMTGIEIKTDGEGIVTSQNIEPGSILSKENIILLYLQ